MNRLLSKIMGIKIVILVLLLLPVVSYAQLNENCTVSVLNRTANVKPDGKWIIPNVPSNMGKVRVRTTCVENGVTRSGQSGWVEIQTNRGINVGDIPLEEFVPPPSSVKITVSSTLLTAIGVKRQLRVIATYPDGTTKDITDSSTGTVYRTTNPAIASVSSTGLVTATGTGKVIISASNDMVLSSAMFSVILGNSNDADNDGIPGDWELANGMNPNDPIDAQEDLDNDGLKNIDEYNNGTYLRIADSDGDGIQDGEEVLSGDDGYITNPLLADSDGDGIRDGLEVQTGSNPKRSDSFNLAGALSRIEVSPSNFVLIYNTIIGETARQLTVTGILTDGTILDLTSKTRGTNYNSSDLNIANFGVIDGQVFAGQDGVAVITVTNGGHSASARITVKTFSPKAVSYMNIPAAGYANNVEVNGGYAYIAGGAGGLYIADVSNPSSPYIIGSVDTPGNANDVKVSGNLAFIADGSSGLQIVDVTNPELPAIVGAVDTPGEAWDVVVKGNRAFVADGAAGLQVIDINNPSSPAIVGFFDTPGTAKGVDVTGNLVVLADGNNGISVLDVADTANPRSLGSLSINGDAVDLFIRDNTAYVAAYTSGLIAVDISNPSSPVLISSEATAGYLYDVASWGNFAFGADIVRVNAVPIYDVSIPSNIIFRSVLDFAGYRDDNGSGIAVIPNYLYLTASLDMQENGTTGYENGYTRLYIGQYTELMDDGTSAPAVSISSPANNSEVIEGSTITVTVEATDDVSVASVSLLVDGEEVATDNAAPYQFNYQVPVGIMSLVIGATAIDLANNIGTADNVYLSVVRNQPPSATITSPQAGGTYMEGSIISLSADASDDVGVSNVVFLVNGNPVFTDLGRPYKTDYIIPEGSSGRMTISAKVEDTIGQVSYSSDVIINISPDPKTTVRGRVLDIHGQAIAGAVVTLSNEQGISGITDADGLFSVSGVPTVHGNIVISVSIIVNGVTSRGWSLPVAPFPGGFTNIADIMAKPYELWGWGANHEGQLGINFLESRIDNVTAIDAGGCSTAAIKRDGTVWEWGCSYRGGDEAIPVQVNDLSGVKAVTAGMYSEKRMAVKEDGTVWTWGNDRVPVQVSGLSGVTAIAAGRSHYLVLKDDGTVWAWGYNGAGQLGNGSTDDSSVPVLVSGLSDVIAIDAGYYHTVALKSDGTVWSWGDNSNGQSGDGTTINSSVPVLVRGLSDVIAIDAGYYHTVALKSDGTVWALGYNRYGQLGNGTTDDSHVPVQVNGLSDVVAISAGTLHTVALKSDGTVWAWGDNWSFELGGGSMSECCITPIQVTGLSGVVKISAGGDYSLALLSDGTVRAWGYNWSGQLGDGTKDTYIRKTPAKVNSVTGFTSIAAGQDHTLGILSDGTLWSWGSNWYGQLGNNGVQDNYLAPVQISGLTGIKSVAGGQTHSAAVKDDGTVWAWGDNFYGQVGDGTFTDRLTPVLVNGIDGVVRVTGGSRFTIALKGDGTVWAWGNNNSSNLGLGSDAIMSRYSTPVQVTGISGVVTVDAGYNHTVALKEDGTVWAWGHNYLGQLGNGTTQEDKHIPQQVNGISDVVAISAGSNHTVALKSDGTVWAWGYNQYGQIGIGTSSDSQLSPMQVVGLTDVVSIAAGGSHTVAIKRDGTVWAWGYNRYGQLGNGLTDNSNLPVQTIGISGATSVFAGEDHTLVIK